MSPAYDCGKTLIITLSIVGISLTIGLVLLSMQYAHGYIDPHQWTSNKTIYDEVTKLNQLETFVNYCFEHVDRPNPIQDLIDKGFLNQSYQGVNCKTINDTYHTQELVTSEIIKEYNRQIELENKQVELQEKKYTECFNDLKSKSDPASLDINATDNLIKICESKAGMN